ncbi:MAG: metalloregulator ArsR/SmtB family transcription factor [candidate division WOR-3 bacterium]|nr:metalloregulator ArsR/SmtB family transcription factor [candidate division WOR-3 bacterium]
MRRDTDTKQKLALVDEAALLKVLADPTRLRLAVALSHNGETCVCTLAEGLAEPEYKISRHLAVMRSAGLVEARRAGTWMHYRLMQPRNHMEECLWNCFHDYLSADKSVAATLRRVKQMSCEERKRP